MLLVHLNDLSLNSRKQREELHRRPRNKRAIRGSKSASGCHDKRILFGVRAGEPNVRPEFSHIASDGSIWPGSRGSERILDDRGPKWTLQFWSSRSCICWRESGCPICGFVQVEHYADQRRHQSVAHEHNKF